MSVRSIRGVLVVSVMALFAVNALALTDEECLAISKRVFVIPDNGEVSAKTKAMAKLADYKIAKEAINYAKSCEHQYAALGGVARNRIKWNTDDLVPLVAEYEKRNADLIAGRVQEKTIGPDDVPMKYWPECRKYGVIKSESKTNPWSGTCVLAGDGEEWIVEMSATLNERLSSGEKIRRVRDGETEYSASISYSDLLMSYESSDASLDRSESRLEWNKAIEFRKLQIEKGRLAGQCEGGEAKACYSLAMIGKTPDKALLKKACEGGVSEGCSHLKEVEIAEKAQAAKTEKLAIAERKKNSKECAIAKQVLAYCSSRLNIRLLELQIAHDKRVGQETGFVNAARLNRAVSAKIQLDDLGRNAAEEIKRSRGQAPTVEECGIVDQPPMGAKISGTALMMQKNACGD